MSDEATGETGETDGTDEDRAARHGAATHGVVIGVLAGIDELGRPLVAYAGNPSPLPVAARSTSDVDPEAAGREVALLFEGGDIRKPLLIGIVQSGRRLAGCPGDVSARLDSRDVPAVPDETELLVDDERVDIEARERIVLRCGKASITLTRAGKVIIRGAYVSSRSSGANRIKGGSVQIN